MAGRFVGISLRGVVVRYKSRVLVFTARFKWKGLHGLIKCRLARRGGLLKKPRTEPHRADVYVQSHREEARNALEEAKKNRWSQKGKPEALTMGYKYRSATPAFGEIPAGPPDVDLTELEAHIDGILHEVE